MSVSMGVNVTSPNALSGEAKDAAAVVSEFAAARRESESAEHEEFEDRIEELFFRTGMSEREFEREVLAAVFHDLD